MMHCAATLSSASKRQAFASASSTSLRMRNGRLRAGLQAGERAGGGGAAQRLFERQAGRQARAEIAAEGVAGADRVDRRDLERGHGEIAFRRRRQ